jgi:hypothetical protein
MRSRYRCSMCPAIHINSRSWLRSSSTHEPSDPPLRVVISLSCSISVSKRLVDPRNGAGRRRNDTHRVASVRLGSLCFKNGSLKTFVVNMGDRYERFFEPGSSRSTTELYSTDASRSRKVPVTSSRQRKREKSTFGRPDTGSLSLRHKVPERAHQ